MRRLALLAVLVCGCSSKTEGPTPTLTGATPATFCDAKHDATLTITGTNLGPIVVKGLTGSPLVQMPQVFLVDASGNTFEVPPEDVTVPDATGTSLVITIPMSLVMPGTFDIEVVSPDGKTATLAAVVKDQCEDLTILSIEPPFGCMCDETTVTIRAAGGLASTPIVEMRPAGQNTPVTSMKRVAFVDANTITAVVPEGLSLGEYDVRVINPPSAGGEGDLANAFRVVQMKVPTIEQVVPDRGPPSTSIKVDIYGSSFRAPITVQLLDRMGMVAATASTTSVVSPTHATAMITTPATEDAYLVRVTDTDEMTYSDFSAFIVGAEGASGNLHTFTASTTLLTGRRQLAGVSARDDIGNTFIYAIGGNSGAAALDTVEVAELSKFGALGPWHAHKTKLATARDAPIAATVELPNASDPFGPPVKTYVYVIGGRSAAAVLDTVERAMVLRNADAPVVTSIAAATGGSLAAGTWYYKVSAICAASDADNPSGETLASDEQILTIDSNHPTITLAWTAVATPECTAVGYKVYRTAKENGTSQQELLIATLGTDLRYTDTGATAGTETPLAAGSLGAWTVEPITLATARWGHQGATIVDGNGGRFLYVLGGKSNATTGYLDTIEYAAIDANGHLVGTKFITTATNVMPTATAFFSLVVETSQNVAGFTGARLIISGGADAGGASKQLQISSIAAGGGNGPWTPGFTNGTLLTASAGNMAVIASNKLWSVGGARMFNNTTQAFQNIASSGDDVAFNASGDLVAPTNSAANLLPAPRAAGVPIVGAGFIYFVGGTSDGTDATTTTYQTF